LESSIQKKNERRAEPSLGDFGIRAGRGFLIASRLTFAGEAIMRALGIVSLVFSVAVMGCNRSMENSIDSIPKKDVQMQGPGPVELHFALVPAPRLLHGQNELPLPELTAFVVSLKAAVTKWTVYLPDDVPVDTAIDLLAKFEKGECSNVAVYAEDARGDCAKRDICVNVEPRGPVQVVTEFTQVYPEFLKEYVGKHGGNDVDFLVAKCQLGELGLVLRPLLAMCKKKHVRLMESGGPNGMPGRRYVEVLDVLRDLGVETVSFYGVYAE